MPLHAGTIATGGASIVAGTAAGAVVGSIPGAVGGFAAASVGVLSNLALETVKIGARAGVDAVTAAATMAANSLTTGNGTVVSIQETAVVDTDVTIASHATQTRQPRTCTEPNPVILQVSILYFFGGAGEGVDGSGCEVLP